MRITEKIIRDGYFWLPSDSGNKIPGTLTISDGGEIKLEIIEAFGNNEMDIPRIVGSIKEGPVTLDTCFYRSQVIQLGHGAAKSHISVNTAFFGVDYPTDATTIFNTFEFSVEGLEEWLGFPVANIDYDQPFTKATIAYATPEDIDIACMDGMHIKIVFHALLSGISSVTETKISQQVYIKLVSEEERPLSDFIAVAIQINSFFCFAIDKIVSIKNVSATSKKVVRKIGEQKDVSKPVSIKIFYGNYIFSPKEPKIDRHEMLFPFSESEENLPDTFKNWLNIYPTVKQSLNLYFMYKTDASKYLQGKFLLLVQGLETYHRKIHKNKSGLNARLKGLLTSFEGLFYSNGGIDDNRGIDDVVTEIVGIRNYLTHYDNEFEFNANDGEILYDLCMKMEAIFQLHLLMEIGFSNKDIEEIVGNNYSLKQKLEAKNTTKPPTLCPLPSSIARSQAGR